MLKKWMFTGLALLLLGVGSMVAQENNLIKPLNQRQPAVRTMVGSTILYADETTRSYFSIFDMIAGRVPGVWVSGPFGFYRVRVRGAGGPPVLVIDNMPFYSHNDRDLNMVAQVISPADVDYIEIIKSPSAAVLYGGNAANGVIIVHTLRGEDVEEE